MSVSIITVDGPSGSGKGTVCRILADRFSFALLDSGAIYRIAALSALQNGIQLDDEVSLATMAQVLDIRFEASGGMTTTLLNGKDVSKAIREEETGMAASKIAPLPALRAALLARQQAFASEPGLVADGRDMGTVVFPDAQYKFFLTASAEERAHRRVLQLQESGVDDIEYAKILADIQARDDRDINRATAPLKPARDAISIDSSSLSIDEVVDLMCHHINVGVKLKEIKKG